MAGTIAAVGPTLAASARAVFAIGHFQSPEYHALTAVAFTIAVSLPGSSLSRNLVSLLLGLAFGLVDTDGITGQPSFTFVSQHPLGGMDVVTAAVELFTVGQTFWVASHLQKGKPDLQRVPGSRASSSPDPLPPGSSRSLPWHSRQRSSESSGSGGVH